jgi:hypothetical protein
VESDQGPDQGRFPHAVPSKDGGDGSLIQGEGDPLKDVALAVIGMNLFYCKDWCLLHLFVSEKNVS